MKNGKDGRVTYIGIDYSMSCPAVCAYTPETARVSFWYAHATKHNLALPHISSTCIPDTATEVVRRAELLARQCVSWILTFADGLHHQVWIEDYAFNATGRVFHIGENTGILKYFLLHNGIDVHPVPPTVVKKFATTKGNADKHKMTSAFLKDYPDAQTWVTKFFPRYVDGAILAKSPLSDLADAYWIAKYAASVA